MHESIFEKKYGWNDSSYNYAVSKKYLHYSFCHINAKFKEGEIFWHITVCSRYNSGIFLTNKKPNLSFEKNRKLACMLLLTPRTTPPTLSCLGVSNFALEFLQHFELENFTVLYNPKKKYWLLQINVFLQFFRTEQQSPLRHIFLNFSIFLIFIALFLFKMFWKCFTL